MALADVMPPSQLKALKDLAGSMAKYKRINPVVNGYDAINVLGQGLNKAGPDREKLRAALHTGTYNGVMTGYTFDEKGDGVWEVSVAEIKGGKVNEIERVRLR
jgi:ABC-type branched-subunit amino acid transport system substrate-binding protein